LVSVRLGVDTGGTFTDVVTAAGTALKLLSTPAQPALAVAAGVRAAGGAEALAHGTTVATNALLERRGGRVALISTQGQRDVIEIARQARPSLYDIWADRPEPLVPRSLRFEVPGRLNAQGKKVEPRGSIPPLPEDVDAVAVCLLHSDLNPEQEVEVAAALKSRVPIVCSHQVSPEFREYERTVTTAADAYLLKPCRAYLELLAPIAPEVLVLTSAGGLVPLAQAAARPVSLLLSGPAGGVLAASAAAGAAGFPDCVTFDMGGTSTDVCLIRAGRPEPAGERSVAGLPIRMPALDVHTIGAGGGSIARIDPGGALAVGPESAGAQPGPACYGQGGAAPTVTDADLVAGRIPVEGMAGLGRLNVDAARTALAAAGVTADGVLAVVDQAMTQAVRAVSVERGVDPAHLALVAFGGAGPLHACALADALGMPAVVVPPRAGVLSAVGLLGAPRQVDLVRSWPDPVDHRGAERAAADLAARASADATDGSREASGVSGVSVAYDCRYAGQSHELTVATIDDFKAEHRRRSGYVLDSAAVEVVALRATARVPSPVDPAGLPAPSRTGRVAGPSVIAEPDCTIWVAAGWMARVDPSGSWILRRVG
jgi:N-methylhydantoinase A/oxoprolinase/acetone carboxylase beta subunit